MNSTTRQETYEESAAAHGRLLLGAEAVLAQWPHDVRKATEVRPDLIRALSELRSKLQIHFAAEETPEYLSEAVTAAPRLTVRAKALQQQHADFLATLEHVIANVLNSELAGDHLARERESLQKLISDLRRHERAEDDLLLESLDDDIGSGD